MAECKEQESSALGGGCISERATGRQMELNGERQGTKSWEIRGAEMRSEEDKPKGVYLNAGMQRTRDRGHSARNNEHDR